MSLINDYTTHIQYDQRRSELMVAAAQDRLARGIRASSDPWWRRLVGAITPAPKIPAGVRTHHHPVAR